MHTLNTIILLQPGVDWSFGLSPPARNIFKYVKAFPNVRNASVLVALCFSYVFIIMLYFCARSTQINTTEVT